MYIKINKIHFYMLFHLWMMNM